MNSVVLTRCKQSITFVFHRNAMYSNDDLTPDSKSPTRTDGNGYPAPSPPVWCVIYILTIYIYRGSVCLVEGTSMTKTPRVDNDALLAAGLELMKQNGKPLTKQLGFGRAMMYTLANGETVRVRTCNDHILIVLADQPSEEARLNIEGTDWLLMVMPEIERTPGKVRAYLVPTDVAVEAVRTAHKGWLDTNPNTKGANKTWALWFRKDAPANRSNDFETKWSQYRLQGEADTQSVNVSESADTGNVKTEVEYARQRISKAAGVAPEAVKITIEFGL